MFIHNMTEHILMEFLENLFDEVFLYLAYFCGKNNTNLKQIIYNFNNITNIKSLTKTGC